MKVCIIQRNLLHYRINLIERISNSKNIELTFLHGEDIKNTKFKNFKGKVNFKTKKLKTLQYVKGTHKSLVYHIGLVRELKKINPDIILMEGESNMINNIKILLYCKMNSKPYIWWSLGQIPNTKESLYQKLYRPIRDYMIKNAKYIIGYSSYSKEYYSKFVEAEKVLIANNCLDNEKIDKEIEIYKNEAKDVIKKYQLQNKNVIMFIGNIEKRKKVDNLINAFDKIQRRISNVALLIVGDGNEKINLENYVREIGLNNVYFTGEAIKDASKYFLASDLFVLPGLGGLSIHHAMIHSLPIISVEADGTEQDLIYNNKNGFIIENNNIDELVEKVIYILQNNKEKFGYESRKIVDEKINITNMVNVFRYSFFN